MKVGIIGPQDLVEKSIEVGSRYKEIEIISLPYTDENKTINSIKEYEKEVDAFLFTGFLPYYIIKNGKLTKKSLFYYPILGSALYRTLFNMNYKKNIDVTRVSIDTLKTNEVIEVYKDLGLSYDKLFLNDLHLSNYSREQYVNFHKELYEKGNTKGAITSINSVYNELTKLGISVSKIEPTKYTMKDTFKMISISSKTQIAKNNQILIMIVDIGEYSLNNEKLSKIEMQEKRLHLHQLLLDYSREYQASVFVAAESQEYIVLITKGILQEYTDSYENIPMVNEIKSKFAMAINVGIGMGINALEAEENARLALKLSRESKDSYGYLVDQDKVVLGPIGSKNKLEYELKTENEYLLNLSKLTNVSISNLTMIKSMMERMQKDVLTASNIKDNLDISLRSANRIMKKLVDSKIAIEAGIEQSGGRGRPSKTYKILIK